MSYSNRIFFYGPVGLLLLIVVLYSVFWRVQADTLAARLDRANGGEVMPGVVFAFAEKSVSGYPFRLDAVLSGVTFSHRAPDGETAWRTEQLAVHALSYNQNRFIFEVTGLQSFARPPLAPGTVPRVTYVTPAIARASAIFVTGKLTRFDLDLWGVQAKEATVGADPKATFTADRAQLHLLAHPDNTVDVAVQIANAKIGAGYTRLVELALPTLALMGKLTQAQAFGSLTSGQTSIADAASAWRQNAGVLSVSDLAVNWGDAHADLKGDLTLDEQGNVAGTLNGEQVINGNDRGAFGLSFANGTIRLASRAAARTP
jgi:hypothetical protein